MLQMRINEVEQIFNQVMTLMDGCPDALKLEMSGTPGAKMSEWVARLRKAADPSASTSAGTPTSPQTFASCSSTPLCSPAQ